MAVEDSGDLADLGGEGGEFLGQDGLHAVRKRLVRLVMDFDQETVGADGDGRARKRENLVAFSGAVAGINENGQMAALLDGGDNGQVQSVARVVGKGADAALAKHYVVVAFGEDVFGGHEKLIKSGGHAALEENRFPGAAGALEERKILHIAGADLNDVGVLFDEVEAFIVDSFGDDAKAEFFPDFRENLEALFAETLKTVRGSAGFVSAAAEEARAGFFDALGDGQALLFGFDGAGAGDQGNVVAADDDIAGRRGDSEDAVFFLGVAADELVRLADGDAFDHAGKGFEDAQVDGALVAGNADGGADGTRDGMGLQAEALDALADFANLLLGGVGLHDDEHGGLPRRGAQTLSLRQGDMGPQIGHE